MAVLIHITATLAEKMIITLGFLKRHFFAENWPKSPKTAIATLIPGVQCYDRKFWQIRILISF
jgi:hypothetical protein